MTTRITRPGSEIRRIILPAETDVVPEELRPLAAKYVELDAVREQHRFWLRHADEHKRAAEALDAAALADAISKGKKDPGPKALEKWTVELADRRRHDVATATVLDELGRQMRQLADEHRAAWLEAADALGDAAVSAAQEALARFADAREAMYEASSRRRWLASFPDRGWRVHVPGSPELNVLADEVGSVGRPPTEEDSAD